MDDTPLCHKEFHSPNSSRSIPIMDSAALRSTGPVCPPLDQRSRDHFAAPIGNSEHVQRDDLDGGVM